MTYNTGVPNINQSPALFPGQANDNFTRLKTIVNAEHVFNDTTAVDDGVHRQVTLVARSNPVAPLIAGTNGIMYNFLNGPTAQVYYFNGTSYYLVSCVMAAVNFDAAGALRNAYNVSSVTVAAGIYTINFTNALPSNSYVVNVTGMSAVNGGLIFGSVAGSATYANSIDTTFVKVTFSTTSGQLALPMMGSVLVVSPT